jgi:glycosyltransferase involved in cell wall biosynthesis
VFSRAKIVVHLHRGMVFRDTFYRLSNFVVMAFIRVVLTKVDTGIVLGHSVTGAIDGFVKTIKVVPNGIPVEKREIVTKGKNEITLIGYLGNFLKTKGIIDFVLSVKKVVQECPNVHFIMAGAWDHNEENTKEDILRYIAENNLATYIDILGPIYGQEKIKFFQQLDIFVFPSWDEGMPLVILEAMNYGLPVISTKNVGTISEVVLDGVTGILIEKNNIEECTQAMKRLIRDKSLRHRLGEAGYNRLVTEYSIDRNIEKVIDVFNWALSKE